MLSSEKGNEQFLTSSELLLIVGSLLCRTMLWLNIDVTCNNYMYVDVAMDCRELICWEQCNHLMITNCVYTRQILTLILLHVMVLNPELEACTPGWITIQVKLKEAEINQADEIDNYKRLLSDATEI